jgi:hypothetical protein
VATETFGALERIRKLDQERSELIDAAKAEALRVAQEAVANLNALGFPYVLTEGGAPKKSSKAAAVKTRSSSEGPCPVCNFQTDPVHDGRAHRGQKKKTPFTKAELEERGMAKV